MNTTRRYTVLIVRGYSGHIAFTPRLPDVVGRGRERKSAYKDFRAKLHQHIAGLVNRGVPAPEDDIVSVKYLKVDLRALAVGGCAAVHLVSDPGCRGTRKTAVLARLRAFGRRRNVTPQVSAPVMRLPRYKRASSPPRMQVTARDLRILNAVCDMRFLTREQVQELLFSPSTASYCKRRLALLYHNAYLDRIYVPSLNAFGATKAIHTLASEGVGVVAHDRKVEVRELRLGLGHNDRELYFMRHTLAINDFRVRLTLAAQERGLSLVWTDERALRRREMKDYVEDPKQRNRRLAVVPDGYFTLDGGERTSAFALEIDRATVEDKPFKEKVRAYGEWKVTGAHERRYPATYNSEKAARAHELFSPADRLGERLAGATPTAR